MPFSSLLIKILRKTGANLLSARSGEEAIDIFKNNLVDIILLDQRMPGMSGLEVLKKVKTLDPDVVVVMMTGYGTIEEAVEAMKLGAYHYLTKPFNDPDEISVIADKAFKERELLNEIGYLKKQMRETFSFNGIIGKSKIMKGILDVVMKVAPTDSTILLFGESGTGKELLARTIHQQSLRKDKKFIAVDCGAIPETLLEGILFGFQKGAFTGALKTTRGYFEESDEGTLFLDEITETSPKFQASILRVIQEKDFSRLGDTTKIKTDFRLITATNKNLQQEVEKGNFREDLYYRINVIPVRIPPLRERIEDIPFLATHFLERFNQKLGRGVGPFTPEAISTLENAQWKGNVRELENLIERIVTMMPAGKITSTDILQYLTVKQGAEAKAGTQTILSYKQAKELFDKRYIKDVLENNIGNISNAARQSGIKRQNLYCKLKKYGIK
ncbi:MAG: sigma-54-dependent Fis family transcriptional regulator [Deltaproteobacteria bacterium]|nr:sigma-54-dependent Fis family transcriptional regulator [Deltaproteobacteria bacterium]